MTQTYLLDAVKYVLECLNDRYIESYLNRLRFGSLEVTIAHDALNPLNGAGTVPCKACSTWSPAFIEKKAREPTHFMAFMALGFAPIFLTFMTLAFALWPLHGPS